MASSLQYYIGNDTAEEPFSIINDREADFNLPLLLYALQLRLRS